MASADVASFPATSTALAFDIDSALRLLPSIALSSGIERELEIEPNTILGMEDSTIGSQQLIKLAHPNPASLLYAVPDIDPRLVQSSERNSPFLTSQIVHIA